MPICTDEDAALTALHQLFANQLRKRICRNLMPSDKDTAVAFHCDSDRVLAQRGSQR